MVRLETFPLVTYIYCKIKKLNVYQIYLNLVFSKVNLICVQ